MERPETMVKEERSVAEEGVPPNARRPLVIVVGELLAVPRLSFRVMRYGPTGVYGSDVAAGATDQLVHEAGLDPEVDLVRIQGTGHIFLERGS